MMSLASTLILLALAPTAPAPTAASAQRVATTTTVPRCSAVPPPTQCGATTHGSPRPWHPGWNCPPSPSYPVAPGNTPPVVQVIIVNAPVYGDVVMVSAPVSTRRLASVPAWNRMTGTSRTLASK